VSYVKLISRRIYSFGLLQITVLKSLLPSDRIEVLLMAEIFLELLHIVVHLLQKLVHQLLGDLTFSRKSKFLYQESSCSAVHD